jgi:NitT/TauT family transport system substrate-binding protein
MDTRASTLAPGRRPARGTGGPGTPGGWWSARHSALQRLFVRLCAVVALAGLSACVEAPRPPLTVGLNPWVGYDPLVLARERGLAETTRVKIVELSSHAESFRHFRNGLLDAMAITLDQALELADEGLDLRVIAVLDESAGADVVMGQTALDRPSAVRGSRVALEASALNRLMLQRWLASMDLQEDDVTVVTLEASQHLPALQAGRVSAAVSYEPLAGQMRDAGYTTLFDTRQMPGEIVDVLVVTSAALRERPADVDALLKAWSTGLTAYLADPAAAAAVLAPGTGLTVAQYQTTQAGLHYFTPVESLEQLTGQPSPLQRSGERLATTLRSLGLLRQPVDWGRLIDAGPAARSSPGVSP